MKPSSLLLLLGAQLCVATAAHSTSMLSMMVSAIFLSTPSSQVEATYAYSPVCGAALVNSSLLTNGQYSRPQLVYNTGDKKQKLFYLQAWGATTTMGLWCATVGDDLTQPLGTPVLVTNVSGIIDYEVASTKSKRQMVAIVRTNFGIRTRSSTDGGLTWGSSTPYTHLFTTAADGQPQGSGGVVQPASYAFTYDGAEFTMAYYVRAPGEYDVIYVESMNGTSDWNAWGFDPAANTYNGVAVNATAARGSGGAQASAYLRSDLIGTSPIAIASDGVYVLVAYQLADNSMEFQTAPVSGVSHSLTRAGLGTTQNIGARRQIQLASTGVTNNFLMVSVVPRYSEFGSVLSNDIVAEVTTNGGKTWSPPRMVRLAAQQPHVDAVPLITIGYTSEWIVIWNEITTGIGSGPGGDLLISASPTGQLWSSPSLFMDGNTTTLTRASMYVKNPTSYIVAYDVDTVGIEMSGCSVNAPNFGFAASMSDATSTGMSMVVALVAIVMGARQM